MTTWAFQLSFSLPLCLKQNKYLFSQPRHLRILLRDLSRQLSSCTPFVENRAQPGQISMCDFQITALCKPLVWDTNGTKSPDFLMGIRFFLWRHFLSNWVCPFYSLLYICFYWKPVLYCKWRVWRQLHVFWVESSPSGIWDQCLGKSSFPESHKHSLIKKKNNQQSYLHK